MSTTSITRFSDLNITSEKKVFVGKSIEIEDIIGKEIIVLDYKIGESKFKEKGNGKCLTLQIEYENVKRVVFSGSGYLMDLIGKINKSMFPVKTTIVKEKESKRLLFT